MRTVEEQIRNRCIHFTGVQNDTCKAGVSYAKFRPSGKGIPCVRFKDESPPQCEKREMPSDKQVAIELAEHEAFNERFKKKLPIIARVKEEHKGSNWRGVEVCPVCGGKLHLSHAGFNGHVHGRCETEGCMSWME